MVTSILKNSGNWLNRWRSLSHGNRRLVLTRKTPISYCSCSRPQCSTKKVNIIILIVSHNYYVYLFIFSLFAILVYNNCYFLIVIILIFRYVCDFFYLQRSHCCRLNANRRITAWKKNTTKPSSTCVSFQFFFFFSFL